MGHRHSSGDQQIGAVEAAGTTLQIDRTLEIHSDVISDTPETRAALQGLMALTVEITRRFLEGELTREQTEAFLISIWRAGVKDAVPAWSRRPSQAEEGAAQALRRRPTSPMAAPATAPASVAARSASVS
jgi:hypothetical protein